MKLALLGYGKMGKLVERTAQAKGYRITSCIKKGDRNWEGVDEADICIDFSHADAVIAHLEQCAKRKKNIVIGTTGWLDRLDVAKAIAEKGGIGVLYSPNFSLGVCIFLKILEQAAQMMNHCPEYDIGGVEFHHRQKKDAPSGTAREITGRLKANIDRIDHLEFSSVRIGSVFGKHLVIFDSLFDTISISHEAKSREGFAIGAIEAATWLVGKTGFFTMDDWMEAKGIWNGS